MRSSTFSDSLSTSTLFVFLIGAAFLVGCDSSGPDMSNQGLTLDKLSGNWELTPEYRERDVFQPRSDPMWIRVIPKGEFSTKFPDADSLEQIDALGLLYIIEADCSQDGPLGIFEVTEDGFKFGGADTKFLASVEDSSMTWTGPEESPNEPPFEFRRVDRDVYRIANNDNPVIEGNCNFQDIDTPVPTHP